jgi:hypothetical protein
MPSRWTRGSQLGALALCLILCMAGGARAQSVADPDPVPQAPRASQAPEAPQEPALPAADHGGSFPLDVAGYDAVRNLTGDDLADRNVFREYSGSIFVSKTIHRWLFHSEINANTAPEWDSEGIHLLPRMSHLSVKLETASVNFNWRDGLQVQAGFLFVPTYWRTHRYQSTTLTVDEPLIDQAVFPTAFTGAMIHGDRYLEEGGISYQIYAGYAQQANFEDAVVSADLTRSRAAGGKVVWHVPSQHMFHTFDVGFHVHRALNSNTSRTHIYGTELNLEAGRIQVLGEFADASVGALPGQAGYYRQGFYLQPSYRIAPQLFVVARYERLNRDSRNPDVNRLAKQSLGLTYRPVPAVSLKLEADRFEPQRGRLPPYYGVGFAVVYFFRVP